MATVTKRPYKIPSHKYWITIEDKYLVDYSDDIKKLVDVDINKVLQDLINLRANMQYDLIRLGLIYELHDPIPNNDDKLEEY